MNWASIGRFAVRSLTGTAVSTVVMNAVRTTTPKDLSKINNILTKVGGFVIASMVSDAAADYVEGQIDEMINPNSDDK